MIKKIKDKIVEKWDFWIYYRAFNSLKRICERNPGFNHIMECHLKKYNEQNPVSESLKNSAEMFYNECLLNSSKKHNG